MLTRAGQVTSTTSGNGATQTIDVGFPIKGLILWTTFQTADSTASRDVGMCIGFASAANASTGVQQRSAFSFHDAGVSGGAAAVSRSTTDIIATYTKFGSLRASVAFSGNAFTLTWGTGPTTGLLLHYLALGGDDLSAVAVDWSAASTTAGSTQTITTPGFDPHALILANVPTAAALSRGLLGFGVDTFSGARWAEAESSNPSTSTVTDRTFSNAYSRVTAGTDRGRGHVSAWGTGQITWLWDTAAASTAEFTCGLALRCTTADIAAGVLAATPDTADSVTGLTFRPSGVLVGLNNTVTPGTVGASGAVFGIGAATTAIPAAQVYQGIVDLNAQATSASYARILSTLAAPNINHASGAPILSSGTITPTADGFTLGYVSGNTGNYQLGWVAFPTSGSNPITANIVAQAQVVAGLVGGHPLTAQIISTTSVAGYIGLYTGIAASIVADATLGGPTLGGTFTLNANLIGTAVLGATNLRLVRDLSSDVAGEGRLFSRFDPVKIVARPTPRGLISVAAGLWIANIHGLPLVELSEYVTGGELAVNLDRAVPGSIRLQLRDRVRERPISNWWVPKRERGEESAPLISAYSDWLLVTVKRRYSGGREEEESVGLFSVEPPGEEIWPDQSILSFSGYDTTWALSQEGVTSTWTSPVSARYTDEIRRVIRSGLHGLPDPTIAHSTKRLPAEMTWNAGTTKLKIANDLLAALGYFPLAANQHGQLYASPMHTIRNLAHVDIFAGGPGSVVIPPLASDIKQPNLCNRVVVRRNDTKLPPLAVVRSNYRSASPVSIPNMRRTIVKIVERPALADIEAATIIADHMLDDGETWDRQLKLKTIPTNIPDKRDTVLLRLTRSDDVPIPSGWGKYYRTSWSMSLAPGGTMTHDLRRVESWHEETDEAEETAHRRALNG